MPEAYYEAITEQGSDDVRNELPGEPEVAAEAESTSFAASDD
jgi:glutamate synthase (NADPH/NADH) large chain